MIDGPKLWAFLTLTFSDERPNKESPEDERWAETLSLFNSFFLLSLQLPLLSFFCKSKKMESSSVKPNPFLSFLHHHCNRFASDLSSRFEDTKRLAEALTNRRFSPLSPPFASVSQSSKPSSTTTLNPSHVAKALAGTSVFTVSNTNSEFVLISDPTGDKSIGLLCFRQEDAEAFLAQVLLFFPLYLPFYYPPKIESFWLYELLTLNYHPLQARMRRRELKTNAKVVPINLDLVAPNLFYHCRKPLLTHLSWRWNIWKETKLPVILYLCLLLVYVIGGVQSQLTCSCLLFIYLVSIALESRV